MKRIVLTACFLFVIAFFGFSQNTYEEFVKQRQQEMTDFKNKADAEFAKYLEERWAEFQEFRAIEKPTKPKPKETPVVPPKVVLDLPEIPDASDLPDVPFPVPDETIINISVFNPSQKIPDHFEELTIDYFGQSLYFQIDKNMRFTLADNKETAVANVWEQLCKTDYSQLIADCKSVAGENGENDWAFYLLADKIAETCFGENAFNEKNLLKMFILCQAGYKVKVARSGDYLFLLTASEQPLYGINYLKIEDLNYYIFNAELKKSGDMYYTFKKDFSQANHKMNLVITKPLQNIATLTTGEYAAKGCHLNITICKDEILKSYYSTYPQCDVIVYAEAKPSNAFTEMILPQFTKAVEGKSQYDAVSMILNFCQTAFEYMTDGDQFGFEKPFFPEEPFYYPFCDCEDRSILFSFLVRNVLNMDVILLDYPQHIATAVYFTEDVQGDYVMENGKKYIICDPTYIGASVGMEMPEFTSKKIQAKPIIINN